MGRRGAKTVLFLCTGNYYRSRFAECLFNAAAGKMGLPWQADSRGLALERGIYNVGPMAAAAVEALEARRCRTAACDRMPAAATAEDFERAALVVALKDEEHRPLLRERFPAWADKVEFWTVEDDADALPVIERAVNDLIARLLGGGGEAPPEPPSPPAAKKPASPVRVGRETKGRRGKGVTTVFDLPPDADPHTLAARLKEKCGTGGTVKDGRIEIQGDQRDRIATELERLGYTVKRTGG